MQLVAYKNTMAGAKLPPKKLVHRSPEEIREDNRTRGLRVFRRRGMPDWARSIVDQASVRTSVGIDLIASDSKIHRIVRARDEAIYRIREARPTVSAPLLGKWFGRDHTSVLYSIAAHSERTGAPALTTYALRRARKRMAAFKRWQKIRASDEGRPS